MRSRKLRHRQARRDRKRALRRAQAAIKILEETHLDPLPLEWHSWADAAAGAMAKDYNLTWKMTGTASGRLGGKKKP